MEDFGPVEERPQRNRGINLSKFTEKCQSNDFSAHMMPIYHRASKKAALDPLYQKFPREALIMFSDKCRKDILQPKDADTPTKAIYLDKGGNKQAFKGIFEWIKQCIATGELAEFETYDDDAPETIARYIEIIRAAEYMEVPARDLQDKLVKRLRKLAKVQREKARRVSWELLEDLYSDDSAVLAQKIAACTVFFSWWYGHIDSVDTPQEMEILAELREDYPALDEDLKAEFEDQKRFLDERKKKKDAERDGAAAFGTNNGWDEGANGKTGGAGTGDWQELEGAADTWGGADEKQATSNGWDGGKENIAPASGHNSLEQPQPASDGLGDANGNGGDWADEVNQEHAANQW